MSSVKRFITCFCLTVGIATICQGQGWRGIVPLHSTRADVERLIGRPTESNGITYNLKTERVSIIYAGGACVKGWPYGWNVKPGVVVDILVYLQTPVTLDQLGVDLTNYTKTTNVQLGGTDYTNKNDGVSIGVKDNGEVEVVQYRPSAKDKNLLCPDAAEREREIESGQSASTTPLLYYFNVSPKEETVRLEVFADRLKEYPPESNIYIIGYAGSEECANEGIIRADRVKEQLVAKLSIDRKRIATIDGGRNSAVWIELYIIRPGEPRPLSTPDIHPALAKGRNCSSKSKAQKKKGSVRRASVNYGIWGARHQQISRDQGYSRFEEYDKNLSENQVRDRLDALAGHLKLNPSLRALVMSLVESNPVITKRTYARDWLLIICRR